MNLHPVNSDNIGNFDRQSPQTCGKLTDGVRVRLVNLLTPPGFHTRPTAGLHVRGSWSVSPFTDERQMTDGIGQRREAEADAFLIIVNRWKYRGESRNRNWVNLLRYLGLKAPRRLAPKRESLGSPLARNPTPCPSGRVPRVHPTLLAAPRTTPFGSPCRTRGGCTSIYISLPCDILHCSSTSLITRERSARSAR